MKNPWVVIDCTNIYYRSYFVHDHINKHGRDVGPIMGTMRTIKSMADRYGAKQVVAVFDGKDGSKKKKKILGTYKDGRAIPTKLNLFNHLPDRDRKEASEQNFLWGLRHVAELTAVLPVKRLVFEGYEADEIVGYVCRNMLGDEPKIIVSNDKDYHQLVDEKCSIYNHDQKKILSLEDIKTKWGTWGTNLLAVRCFLGDTSDCIDGISGVGPKTLEKRFPALFDDSLRPISSVGEILEALEGEDGGTKADKAWRDHVLNGIDKKLGLPCREILQRNWELMQLSSVKVSSDVTVQVSAELFDSSPRFDKEKFRAELLKEGMHEQLSDVVEFWSKFSTKNALESMEF